MFKKVMTGIAVADMIGCGFLMIWGIRGIKRANEQLDEDAKTTERLNNMIDKIEVSMEEEES